MVFGYMQRLLSSKFLVEMMRLSDTKQEGKKTEETQIDSSFDDSFKPKLVVLTITTLKRSSSEPNQYDTKLIAKPKLS